MQAAFAACTIALRGLAALRALAGAYPFSFGELTIASYSAWVMYLGV
jgi:hypothetical protein